MRAPLADEPVVSADFGEVVPDEVRARLRASLLSVYYASVGTRFEVRGAPSVLVRPQIQLMPLRDALKTLSEESDTRFREAVWLLVRSTRLQGTAEEPEERYPDELGRIFPHGELELLSKLRREYRRGANLFAAALVAIRDGDFPQLEALHGILNNVPPSGAIRSFQDAVWALFGMQPAELLAQLSSLDERSRARKQMTTIESEIGLNLYDFVEDFAHAVAFNEWAEEYLPGNWALPRRAGALNVLPVSSVVVQSARTLQTKVTVTTVVHGRWEELRTATDPRLWSKQSDLMKRTNYVKDAFPEDRGELSEEEREAEQVRLTGQVGSGFDDFRLLEEEGTVTWGRNSEQGIWFHNILRLTHTIGSSTDPGRQDIDIDYGLCRSIESRVLWDRRPGGLLIDHGYLKVRYISPGRWRVTWSKAVRFSDRTPFSGSPGWTDFGELLNYLAPAALTWWVETETYSLGDRPYRHSSLSGDPLTRTPEEAL